MTPWQRRARILVAVLAIGVIAVVAYTMRPRESAAPPIAMADPGPDVTIATSKGNIEFYKGETRDIRIEFNKQETYKDGQTRLFDVHVLVNNRAGRSYTITGKEAQVGKDESSFVVKGDVKMETSDKLVAHSQEATYTDADKIVRAPGPVTFSRGRMTGTGTGFLFDEQRDTLTILENADVHFAPEGQEGPMDVKAGGFVYARRDRYMHFQRTMHMDRGGQLMDADEGTVRLYPDRDETDLVELRGNSRVTGAGQMGPLQSMSARDINLNYGEDGRTLENAVLAGTGVLEVMPKGYTASQRLAAEYMELGMQPDGSLRDLNARDKVIVTLPTATDIGARTITSSTLNAVGAPEGIKGMTFKDGVEYREAATKSHPLRVARSQILEATFNPATGALFDARFTTRFEFTEDTMRATAANAVYKLEDGTMALAGAGATPHIENEELTVDADTIDIDLDPLKVTANGNVRSTLLPAASARESAGELRRDRNATATRRPGLLAEKEPVQIVAAKLVYDETTKRADYSGQTRLLQGETTIQADAITLDETKGDLLANGKVVTNLTIADKTKPADAKAQPMIGRAGSFTYSDQNRLATYTTTAQLDGDQGNLRAAKIEVQLAKAENTLDGLAASGQVTALVDRRTVTGTELNYSPADDKYVVTGAPVKMIDADCQETSGKTLTFWKASDRFIVDGNEEVRTQTKGGGKCPATPQ
jgi:LPS export ABC transporter protein LptC/lipopolysaccharide transport protein LptA